MEMKLNVTKRTQVGSKAAKAIRTAGGIPAIVYGAGKETQPITIKASEFDKVWKSAGESTLIELEGVGSHMMVLIQDVTHDVLYQTPTHVDLLAVDADKPVEVDVPLVFVGIAPAEKELGGILVKVMHELEIEALPKNLPHEITVDISSLKTFDDQIRVEDLKLPIGVTTKENVSEVVALVQAAKEEELTAPVDVSSVEIEKKGKEEIPAEE